MNKIQKVGVYFFIYVMAVAMIASTSTAVLVYASSTTEDDGWVEGDDDSQGEISSQEELEEAYEGSQWEDDIGPNEFEEATNNDDDDDNDDEDNDNKNSPYCDEVDNDYSGSCFDRYDTDDITGLYPCKDGSQVSDPQGCESTSNVETTLNELGGIASCLYDTSLLQCAPVNGECRDGYGMNEDSRCFPEHSKCPDGYHGHQDDESGECIPNNIPCTQGYVMTVMTNGGDNCEQRQQISCVDVPFYLTCDSQKKDGKDSSNNSGSTGSGTSSSTTKTIIVNQPSSTANAADVSNCKLDGSADGIQQIFDTAKYQACKLHTNNDKIYYDGFVTGCMNVGNTKLICETVANSNILNINTQNPETPAATTIPQSLQAIQPAAVN